MGKNVYAAPRKGPAGKWVEQSGEKTYVKDQQQARKEHLQALLQNIKRTQANNER